METRGTHILAEYHHCAEDVLDDPVRIEAALLEAAHQARATVIHPYFHRFSPQGVSGVVVIAESHLSIHTWPESGYAAADFYTCGDCDPTIAIEVLRETLSADSLETMIVDRGAGRAGGGIRVRSHEHRGHQQPRLSRIAGIAG